MQFGLRTCVYSYFLKLTGKFEMGQGYLSTEAEVVEVFKVIKVGNVAEVSYCIDFISFERR